MALLKSKPGLGKKPSCPLGRHCITDSSVCGYIGYYAECPLTLKDRILTEFAKAYIQE
jgi:hypothetical protein